MRAGTLLVLGFVGAIWSSTAVAQAVGYLAPGEQLKITDWLPPAPERGGPIDASDYQIYFQTRALVATARGQEAIADNVYVPAEIAPRFKDALGVTLTSV